MTNPAIIRELMTDSELVQSLVSRLEDAVEVEGFNRGQLKFSVLCSGSDLSPISEALIDVYEGLRMLADRIEGR